MNKVDFDIDRVLNLEQEYYQQGYEEGQEFSTRQQFLEGKEYGYQTGFQRFLIIGYIQGLVNYWLFNTDKYGSESFEKHLIQLNDLLKDIPTTNGVDEVKEYERRVLKSRNKIRIIANICKEQWKVNNLDKLINDVGGQLQVSENMDEMW